jgi:hypothetical protein
MEKSTKTLLGVALIGGAAYLFLNKPVNTTDQSGQGISDGGGSSIGGGTDTGQPVFNFSPPPSSGDIPPVQESQDQQNPISKKAIVAGSAAAASADLNQQINAAFGLGDATRTEGNQLIFNIPRSSGLALAAEKYTAKQYPLSVVNYASGNIGFMNNAPIDAPVYAGASKKAAVTSVAPKDTGIYSPAPAAASSSTNSSGGGAIMSVAPKTVIGVSKKTEPPPYTPVIGVSKVK